jgi:uncharacterized BrkB/YihY/UPF0761 family membrane protein
VRVKDDVTARYEDARHRVPAVDIAAQTYERDRETGGGIIAGALAFRVFLFLLPLVLVLVAALGFAAHADPEAPQDLAKTAGIGGLTAQSVAKSAKLADNGRWVTLAIGLFALYLGASAFVKAMRIAHALAWRQVAGPLKRTWRAVLALVVIVIGFLGLIALAARVREGGPLLGVWATVGLLIVVAVSWLGVTIVLPHGDAPWTALVPGALVFAVGTQILHVVTVYYVAHKVASSSDLYGPIGVAVALLGWAYLFGRLTVAAATLNATMWDRHCGRTPHAALRLTTVDESSDDGADAPVTTT